MVKSYIWGMRVENLPATIHNKPPDKRVRDPEFGEGWCGLADNPIQGPDYYYPLRVKFDSGKIRHYTKEGVLDINQVPRKNVLTFL